MLRVVARSELPDCVRLGMSTLFVRDFIRTQNAASLARVQVYTDHSGAVAEQLVKGAIDIACILENSQTSSQIDGFLVDSFEDRLVWVRARDFVLQPGRPIPVLTWPGDKWMVRALEASGVPYRIVMNSPSFNVNAAAAEAGIGITAVPGRMVPPNLVEANEDYLPPLPALKALMYQRPGLDSAAASDLRRQLTSLFFEGERSARAN